MVAPSLIAFITGWVNRFAHAGDAAMEVAGNTAVRVSYLLQNAQCGCSSRFVIANIISVSYSLSLRDT